ncbi:MAG TPA: RNA polymerase sigma factor [Sphingomonas sp.]|nr:RNA polymerase sigma factor [Sphingomonas sp.]
MDRRTGADWQESQACRAEEAGTALYAAEAPRLGRFFRRRVDCPAEAEDLVQETFTRALGQQGGALHNIGGYLTRIAQNLLRDRSKLARRRSADLHLPADSVDLAGSDLIRLLEVRDTLDRIECVMLELSPTTREIFMAHRIDGLTYSEIAARTGRSVKQVEKAIARAMVELDRRLDSR